MESLYQMGVCTWSPFTKMGVCTLQAFIQKCAWSPFIDSMSVHGVPLLYCILGKRETGDEAK